MPIFQHSRAFFVRSWTKILLISSLCTIFLDPLISFSRFILEDSKCNLVDGNFLAIAVGWRCLTDLFHLNHVFLEIRHTVYRVSTANISEGSINSRRGYFTSFRVMLVEVLALFPVALVLYVRGVNINYVFIAYALQYWPRLLRVIFLFNRRSSIGSVFDSTSSSFLMNAFTYVLLGQVVGSCWYFMGLQRVTKCLMDACYKSGIPSCELIMDCSLLDRKYTGSKEWHDWSLSSNASSCFISEGPATMFDYGIFSKAVKLVTEKNLGTRYLYSFFWGFQQISTLAGNLEPSFYIWEVVLTFGIIALGLIVLALLLGNMQTCLQSFGQRRLEMKLRRRDIEEWMRHHNLPEELKSDVRKSEQFTLAATKGVNERVLFESLPEDLVLKIRRHLGQPIGSIAERFQSLCLKDSGVLYEDANIQIGIKAEWRAHHGRMVLFLGNKNIGPLESVQALILPPAHLKLELSQVPETIPPGAQVQCPLEIVNLRASRDVAVLDFSYKSETSMVNVKLRIPAVLNKFLQSMSVSPEEFFPQWRSLSGPPLKLQEVVRGVRSMSLTEMANLFNSYHLMVCPGLDPNPNNLVACTTFNSESTRAMLCLMKIETDPTDRTQLRMTVASGDPALTFELKEIVKELLVDIPTSSQAPTPAPALPADLLAQYQP